MCPELGNWAEDKYRLLFLYDELFSTAMKEKWGKRVYIDLYSGAGYGKVRGTERILKGSPLLALSVPHKFDKYIFCEGDRALREALEVRSRRIAPEANVVVIPAAVMIR